jgi:hypothetical protein
MTRCTDDETLIREIIAELDRARAKFPGDNVTTLAMAEEAGELATAVFEEPRAAVRKEAIQTAVMAMRVVLDGDATLRLWRAMRGLDPLTEGEHLSGAESIALERHRQVTKEGWTPAHDDGHDEGELAFAAACYALEANAGSNLFDRSRQDALRELWPFNAHWWKPKDRRSDLVRAGALIAAEIDRLDRLAEAQNDG